MREATVHTIEWGFVHPDKVVLLRCPRCGDSYHARRSGDGASAEMPRHGPTIQTECPGGGRWYKLTQLEK
jgi:hypothetical protein